MPIIYTPSNEEVAPAYNIRTDKWEVAIDAMSKIYETKKSDYKTKQEALKSYRVNKRKLKKKHQIQNSKKTKSLRTFFQKKKKQYARKLIYELLNNRTFKKSSQNTQLCQIY